MKDPALLRRMLVSDGRGDAERIERVFRAAYDAGFRAFQLRERDLPDRLSLELLHRLRRKWPRGKALLLVNDRVDLALAGEADGVQLGFRSISSRNARRLLGPKAWIGASIHHIEETRLLARESADYLVFGPVFATPSKRGILSPVGLKTLRTVVRRSTLPVIAIGGIGASRVAKVLASGCAGYACIREVFDARFPRKRAEALLEAET